jgi:hypothetical protein
MIPINKHETTPKNTNFNKSNTYEVNCTWGKGILPLCKIHIRGPISWMDLSNLSRINGPRITPSLLLIPLDINPNM